MLLISIFRQGCFSRSTSNEASTDPGFGKISEKKIEPGCCQVDKCTKDY